MIKPEINEINRRKFEAIYFVQRVFRSSRIPKVDQLVSGRNLERPNSKYDWLELKSIELFSDEDALELSNFLEIDNPEEGWRENLDELIEYTSNIESPAVLIDWLRNKGYAVPWMGLSVEEMVQAGWIKLLKP